jgi:hypothetical protein
MASGNARATWPGHSARSLQTKVTPDSTPSTAPGSGAKEKYRTNPKSFFTTDSTHRIQLIYPMHIAFKLLVSTSLAAALLALSAQPAFAQDWTPANGGVPTALWLDANDAGTITKDGGNLVSQWNDKSGNARHVTQATAANRPTYQAAGLNGKPAVYFDAASRYLTSAAVSAHSGPWSAKMGILEPESHNTLVLRIVGLTSRPLHSIHRVDIRLRHSQARSLRHVLWAVYAHHPASPPT